MQRESSKELENAESDTEVFSRILAEIVNEFSAFAGELIEIRGSLVDVIEQRFVGDQFTERSFAGLCVSQDRVDLGCGRVEASERLLGVVIELLVFQKLAERSATGGQIAGDHFKIVCDAVYLRRGRTQIDYRGTCLIVKSIVGDKFTGRTATGFYVSRNSLERRDGTTLIR